jgi:hypothetical protein
MQAHADSDRSTYWGEKLMSTRTFKFSRSRPVSLAACVAVALGITVSTAQARETSPTHRQPERSRLASTVDWFSHQREAAATLLQAGEPKLPASSHLVTTCADDGSAGSLRGVIGAAGTFSGDIIDLTQLPMMCSTITLGSEIAVIQDTLYLHGPGLDALTIDGNSQSRIFKHTGVGNLSLYDLTIANAHYTSSSASKGGCIYSSGSVFLVDSVVSHCMLESTGSSLALGAGVYTKGSLSLNGSTITNSHAYTADGGAEGGGAYVFGNFSLKYSTISDSTAYDNTNNANSHAGGVFVFGHVAILGSTISGNRAEYDGGLTFLGNLANSATITNSTISNNTAQRGPGGILSTGPLTLSNSTIAFNVSRYDILGAGLYSQAALTLESSIIADNAGENGPSDLGGAAGILLAGSHNLITASALPPFPDTISSCPQLAPLADNGGPTRTHGLNPASPAIDQGSNVQNLTTDQRLASRVAGANADIGAVEWQPGAADEYIFVAGFDGVNGLCDQ